MIGQARPHSRKLNMRSLILTLMDHPATRDRKPDRQTVGLWFYGMSVRQPWADGGGEPAGKT